MSGRSRRRHRVRSDRTPWTTGTLASLHVRNYRLYVAGQAVSVTGNWMQNVAVAWLVLQLAHSGVILGAVTAARFVPLVLLGPWGGLVTDRSDRRQLMTITQSVAAALSVLLGVISWTGHVSLVTVLGVVVGLGLVNVFDGPARQSLISSLVPREHLGNAIALNSVAMNSSRIFGPGLAGALIATLGITPCFFVNGLSFLVVIASLLAMRESEFVPTEREVRSKGQIRAGLRYVAGTPVILGPLVMVTAAGVFAWEFPVTLPLLTSTTFHGDAATYGLAMSSLGLGSVCGGVAAARRRRISVVSIAVSAILWGASIGCAAAAPSLPFEYALLALVGSGAITFNSAAKTLLQMESAPHMRGRVMSLWSMAWQGSTVVGAPVVGLVGSALGARFGLLVGGVATIAVGLCYLAPRIAPAPEQTPEPAPEAAPDPGPEPAVGAVAAVEPSAATAE